MEGRNNRRSVRLVRKAKIASTMPGGVRAMVAMVLASGFTATAIAQNTVTEVVGGLHSPRGLAFGSGGQLFVAQTGDETTAGSIIEILDPMGRRPYVRTIVTGLANIGLDEGEFLGVSGLAVFGSGINFGLYAVM